MENKNQGLRFNEGKLRYDLVHPVAHEGMVKVLTRGSEKYAPRNWEKGMPWTTVIASLKRHMAAYERGEDFDPETGLLHVDHMACNIHFLSAYYKIAPKFDDRPSTILPKPKIGLDIDDVICVWAKAWAKKFNLDVPKSWFFDKNITKRFDELREKGELDNFYLSLEPNISPDDIPFEPECYVTSRPVASEISTQWLEKHGFPVRPVYTVGLGQSKVDVIKAAKIDIFVDDRYENFEELNRNGILCYLFDAPHNARYNVGYKRIKTLKELI